MNLKKALPLNPRLVINLVRVLCVHDYDDDYMLFYLLFLYYRAFSSSLLFFSCSLYNELLCDYGSLRYFAERESAGKAVRLFFNETHQRLSEKSIYIPTGSYVIIAILLPSIIIRTQIYVSKPTLYILFFTECNLLTLTSISILESQKILIIKYTLNII